MAPPLNASTPKKASHDPSPEAGLGSNNPFRELDASFGDASHFRQYLIRSLYSDVYKISENHREYCRRMQITNSPFMNPFAFNSSSRKGCLPAIDFVCHGKFTESMRFEVIDSYNKYKEIVGHFTKMMKRISHSRLYRSLVISIQPFSILEGQPQNYSIRQEPYPFQMISGLARSQLPVYL